MCKPFLEAIIISSTSRRLWRIKDNQIPFGRMCIHQFQASSSPHRYMKQKNLPFILFKMLWYLVIALIMMILILIRVSIVDIRFTSAEKNRFQKWIISSDQCKPLNISQKFLRNLIIYIWKSTTCGLNKTTEI